MKINPVRFHLWFLIIIILAFCSWRIYEKITILGFEFTPNAKKQVYQVVTNINFKSKKNEEAEVTLAIPNQNKNLKIFKEKSSRSKFDFSITDNKTHRVARWFKSKPKKNNNLFYTIYLYDVKNGGVVNYPDEIKKIAMPTLEGTEKEAAKEIINRISVKSNNNEEFVTNLVGLFRTTPPDSDLSDLLPANKISIKDKNRVFKTLLSLYNIPSKICYSIDLENPKRVQYPEQLTACFYNGKWNFINLNDDTIGLEKHHLIFGFGSEYLLDVIGGEKSNFSFSVNKVIFNVNKLLYQDAKTLSKFDNYYFSIYNLPSGEQNTFKRLCILPLAILMLVFMRNIVGLETMGTFTPILISMVFLETQLIPGIIIFLTVLILGLLVRAYFSKLDLLMVPRVSAVVIVVISLMMLVSTVSYKLMLFEGLKVTFFPLIIFSWIIERSSVVWEEEGALNTIRQIGASLATAIISYYIISNETISHLMYSFNELSLIILVLILMIGSYSGYRLSEIWRFKPFWTKENETETNY